MTTPLRRAVAAALGASAVVLLSTVAPASAKPSQAATVYIVQGIPNMTVSVTIDGKQQAANAAAKDIIGPLSVAPGRHTVTFAATDSNWSLDTKMSVAKGQSSDVVLHRPASVGGDPVVTTYRNPLGAVPHGQGRVVVAHTAVVPPADIMVNGSVLFADIANGEYAAADVPGGTYRVAVLATGTTKNPLLGPLDLPVPSGQLTRVFAIGRPQNGSMDAIVQQLPLRSGSAAPHQINTGSAGLVAGWRVSGVTPPSSPQGSGLTAALFAGATALVAVLCGAFALRRRATETVGRRNGRE